MREILYVLLDQPEWTPELLAELIDLEPFYSPDSHLLIYNWYTQNHGTFEIKKCVVRYQKDEIVQMIDLVDYCETTWAATWFEIHAFERNDSTDYLLIGGGKGCTSCGWSSAIVLSAADSSIVYKGCVWRPITVLVMKMSLNTMRKCMD